jgi:hypothetical protein
MASKIHRGDWPHDSFSPSLAAPSVIDKEAIAGLPIGAIASLNREDLIRVIREGQLPLVDARTLRRLQFLDRSSLERLAHLSRRCCQTRQTQMTDACAASR